MEASLVEVVVARQLPADVAGLKVAQADLKRPLSQLFCSSACMWDGDQDPAMLDSHVQVYWQGALQAS